MKHRWMNNPGLKVISVLVACVIWIVVSNSDDPERTQGYRNVPVTIKNQDTITNANKTFTVADGIDKISVYVTARESVREKLTSSSFTVIADLQKYNADLGTVPLEINCNDAHISQENIRMIPSSLKIIMQDKVEENFGIAVTTSGKAEKGYELGGASLMSGDTIKIAGPRSLINIIGKVTVGVDITGMSSDSVDSYPVRIEDKNGATLTEGQMKNLELKNMDGVSLRNNSVEVSTKIWKIYNNIPIEVDVQGVPEKGYHVSSVNLSPKTLNLVAAEGAMDVLEGSLHLKEAVSVEGMRESQEFTLNLNDTLDAYEDIRLEADTASTVTVQVQIDEVGSKTLEIPISDVKMLNVPKEKRLIFTPADYLPVAVRTEEGKNVEISAEDIRAQIDLKNCGINGSYTLPVEITLPQEYELVNKVSIVVNIEDAENEAEVEALTEE